MTRAKLLTWVIALPLLLILAVVIIVPLVIDPNDYRDEIESAVKRQTGRDLVISGDIGLSLFPWIGLELGRTTLANTPAFGPAPFLSIEEARVKVRLLPLLRRSVEIDTVVLAGLQVDLAIDAEGRSNWQDLVAAEPAPAAETPPPSTATTGPALAALTLGGLEIRDARLAWRDETTATRAVIAPLNLTLGAFVPGRPVPMRLDARLVAEQPALSAALAMEAKVQIDLESGHYAARDLVLETELRGGALPMEPVDLTLRGDLEAREGGRQVTLDRLRLQVLGVALQGEAEVRTTPALGYTATLKSEEFDLRALLARIPGALPETADPNVLKRVRLETAVGGGEDRLALKRLQLTLDDTILNAEGEVRGYTAPRIKVKLDIDQLDADRYLPPPATPAAQGGDRGKGDAASAVLPIAALTGLELDGDLGLKRLKIAGLRSEDIRLKVSAHQGLVRLAPMTAGLYQGRLDGELRLDARQSPPRITIRQSLKQVAISPLLKDLVGKDFVSGTAEIALDLNARGDAPDELVRTLGGKGNLSFADGAIRGVNLPHLIQSAKAKLHQQPPPPARDTQQTDFTTLTASFTVQDGVLRNQDLRAQSPYVRINGEGQVDLPRERIDYDLRVKIVKTEAGQGGETLEELKGTDIPVRIRGALASPDIGVDSEAIRKALAARARQKVQQQVEERREEAQQQLEQKREEKKEELEQRLRNRLKGLLN